MLRRVAVAVALIGCLTGFRRVTGWRTDLRAVDPDEATEWPPWQLDLPFWPPRAWLPKPKLTGRAPAIRAKDLSGSLSHYAPGVVGFDLVQPLRYVGADALRKRLEEWFASFDGTIGFESHELQIIGGDDVAFAHNLNQVTGTLTDGKSLDMYWRATLCLGKIDGEWLVVHTHTRCPSTCRR